MYDWYFGDLEYLGVIVALLQPEKIFKGEVTYNEMLSDHDDQKVDEIYSIIKTDPEVNKIHQAAIRAIKSGQITAKSKKKNGEINHLTRVEPISFFEWVEKKGYTVYVESEERANAFLMQLTHELEKYALSLNPKKTTISKMPVLNRESWIVDLNLFFGLETNETFSEKGDTQRPPIKYRQLKMIIDKAVSLSREYPDGSVMKYAFAGIIDIGVDIKDDGAEQYLIDSLLRYSYYFPALIPLIQRIIGKVSFISYVSSELIFALLERSFEQGQSDNIIWCMYYLLKVPTFTKSDLLEMCCKKDDPMVILMGYVYAKENELSLDALTTWADEKIKGAASETLTEYDIDRFWLVLYQLYHDGVLKSPPYKPHVPAKGKGATSNNKDPHNNEVFELLKKEKVSFIDFEHEDLKKAASPFAAIKKANAAKKIKPAAEQGKS